MKLKSLFSKFRNVSRSNGSIDDRPKGPTVLNLTSSLWSNDFYAIKRRITNTAGQKHKILCKDEKYTVLKLDNSIHVVPASAMAEVTARWPNVQPLLDICQHNESFTINPLMTTPEPLDNKDIGSDAIWLWVRSRKSRSCIIKQGDLVKFGKLKVKIKELGGISQNQSNADIDERETVVAEYDLTIEHNPSCKSKNACKKGFNNKDVHPTEANIAQLSDEPKYELTDMDIDLWNNTIPCRICLGDAQTEDNPLVEPCGCRGSMKYVHIKCLRKWMEGRMEYKSEDRTKCFLWKALNCELCHEIYPAFVKADNIAFPLYELPRPQQPYVILEPETTQNSGLHIISLDSRSNVRIGRGNDADVRLNDISVSRSHSHLKFINEDFIIEDLNSKFGTLIQVRDKLTLQRGQGALTFQIGQNLISICAKKYPRCRLSCFLTLDESKDIILIEQKTNHRIPTLVEKLLE